MKQVTQVNTTWVRLGVTNEEKLILTFSPFHSEKGSCSTDIYSRHLKEREHVQALVCRFLTLERHFSYGKAGFHVLLVAATITLNSSIPLWV